MQVSVEKTAPDSPYVPFSLEADYVLVGDEPRRERSTALRAARQNGPAPVHFHIYKRIRGVETGCKVKYQHNKIIVQLTPVLSWS